MKPEQRPFIVEVKKRRSLSGKGSTIWGAIDLKSATDQIRDEQLVDGRNATSAEPAAEREAADTVA